MSLAELFYAKHPRRLARSRRRPRRPMFESLEARLLLDATPLHPLVYEAAAAVDVTLRVVDDGGTQTVEVAQQTAGGREVVARSMRPVPSRSSDRTTLTG